MAKPWMDSVRRTGNLTVFNGIGVGKWANVFGAALESFNKLSTKHEIGVKLIETKDKNSANIVIQLSDGTSFFEYDGTIGEVVFNATAAHGKTLLFSVDGAIEKAAVFLPDQPRENHINVMKFIAVHELVHACGLDNGDHAGDGVFMTLPNIRNGQIWSSRDSKKMPPLFLAPSTVKKIAGIWK